MTPVKRGLQALSLAMLFAVMAVAQANGPDVAKRLDGLEKATRAAQLSGDNAWMLTSSALVPMMTASGLALFFLRLGKAQERVRHHDARLRPDGCMTILWAVAGYSLAFSEGSPFVGGLRYLFLNGVGADPNADYAATQSGSSWRCSRQRGWSRLVEIPGLQEFDSGIGDTVHDPVLGGQPPGPATDEGMPQGLGFSGTRKGITADGLD
jgi:hypothetical protein